MNKEIKTKILTIEFALLREIAEAGLKIYKYNKTRSGNYIDEWGQGKYEQEIMDRFKQAQAKLDEIKK